MGLLYLQHFGGKDEIVCKECHCYLSHWCNFLSDAFHGVYGQAMLLTDVCNVIPMNSELKDMSTGKHYTRDFECKNCNIYLGWYYEFAFEDDQKYKEQCYIIERESVLIQEGKFPCFHPDIDE